ncbi:MAG: hypothetical protein IPK26_05715 [Planctomycetes bacterium]|nr:hypothetical protein [Planctomycetota bacterium]
MLRSLSVLLCFLFSLFVNRQGYAQRIQISLSDAAGNAGSITMNFGTNQFTADLPGATQVAGRFTLDGGSTCLDYERGGQQYRYGCFVVEGGEWVFHRESNGVTHRITGYRILE